MVMPLEIYFIYSGNKDIYCTFKADSTISFTSYEMSLIL
jgi:hypothetical protein